MATPPVALGLTLCDYVLIEEGSRRVSLIGSLMRMVADRFPHAPPTFCIHAALTDGRGDVTLDLVATRLDTYETVASRKRQIHFTDRLEELQVIFRIKDWTFPAPGLYEIALLVDNEPIAQRRIRVFSTEEAP